MSLIQILIFTAGSALFGLFAAAVAGRPLAARIAGARPWIMLVASVVAMYWLQSSTPVRNMDFWLPTATLGLTCVVWAAVRRRQTADDGWRTGLVIAATVLAIDLTRYVEPLCCLTPSAPPMPIAVVIVIGAWAALALLVMRFLSGRRGLDTALVLLIIGLFAILKTEPLAQAASAALRSLTGQSISQASALDLRWLGFSYIAFRLIHVLRDHTSGRLPALSLREFVTYVVFFPALAAGPIDRAERFVKDLRNWDTSSASAVTRTEDLVEGSRRILMGVFKKFVIADTLAIFALNGVNAAQTASPLWMWVLLYTYAFRLYFDFSGYTDVAIGLGRMFGIKLPENFDRPYRKPNITAFWNSWHMTLSNWFRTYVFNPLTRGLRTVGTRRGASLPPAAIIFIGQTTTMLLIGLWHGVTWNFALWGLWQALGLFVHNRWVDYTRRRAGAGLAAAPQPGQGQALPRQARALNALNVLITFNYVALGWVWFALPSVDLSLAVFRKLFGG